MDKVASVPARSQIAPEHTWNAPSVFPSAEAWQAEYKRLLDSIPELQKFQGRLADGPEVLADALDTIEKLNRAVGRLYVYSTMAHSVDTTDQAAAAMDSQAQG